MDYDFSKIIGSDLKLHKGEFTFDDVPQYLFDNGKLKGITDRIYLITYLLIRKVKPKAVVETGVSHGVSSSFILSALHENGYGHLYSIDKPAYDHRLKGTTEESKIFHLDDGLDYTVKDGFVPGDYVPEFLRKRWTLILGDAKKELPPLLKKIRDVTIFMHDSLHTYEHMLFEYQTAWPFIEKKGFLLSHDITWNRAFGDFAEKKKRVPVVYNNFGIIKK
jgi:hypothetical protein